MTRSLFACLAATGILAWLAGCPAEQQAPSPPGQLPPGGTVIAKVDGHPITQEMLDATIKQLPPQLKHQLEANGQLGRIEDQLIVSDLLYREALKRNLMNDRDVRIAVAIAARNALADAVLDQVVSERMTDARIQKWYEDHAVRFNTPQVKTRLIAVESEQAAGEVMDLLNGGADFAQLARERSKDQASAASGGDLGWVNEKDLAGPIGKAIADADKGQIVGPLQTSGAWLIFKIEDKREQVPLSEARPTVEEALTKDIAQEYIDEIQNKAKIEHIKEPWIDAPMEAPSAAEPSPPPVAPPSAPTGPAGPTSGSRQGVAGGAP